MTQDRTCKRCSVARVNALVKAYHEAHTNSHHQTISGLREVVALAGQRGLSASRGLLTPGLPDRDLRALCWNVASFLEDEEASRILGVRPQPKP